MISASHNPFEDNGIKVFSGTRREVHRARRARGRGDRRRLVVDARGPASRRRCRSADLVGAYLDHLRAVFPEAPPLERLQARRSTAPTARRRPVAPELFEQPRASTPSSSATSPTAATSTCDCGSTHPEAAGAHGRRARLPDGRGVRRRRRPRDLRRSPRPDRRRRRRAADVRRASCSAKGGCKGNAIVATVMSNIGLELALRALGIELVRMRGRRQVRDGGDADARPVARRRAVGPHHLLRLPVHRRRPVHGAERAADGGADRPDAGRSRRRT